VTSAAAFVEEFIPVVRDHGGNSALQCANVRASFATARSHRHGTPRRLALPACCSAYGKRRRNAHTHTKTKLKRKPNADSQGPVMRMLDRFVIVGMH
jgi:hypothetical protein